MTIQAKMTTQTKRTIIAVLKKEIETSALQGGKAMAQFESAEEPVKNQRLLEVAVYYIEAARAADALREIRNAEEVHTASAGGTIDDN